MSSFCLVIPFSELIFSCFAIAYDVIMIIDNDKFNEDIGEIQWCVIVDYNAINARQIFP